MELLINLTLKYTVHLPLRFRLCLRHGFKFLGDHDTALSLFTFTAHIFLQQKKIHVSLKGDVMCFNTSYIANCFAEWRSFKQNTWKKHLCQTLWNSLMISYYYYLKTLFCMFTHNNSVMESLPCDRGCHSSMQEFV